MRLQLPWKRTGKKVIEAVDASSGVEEADIEGKASRGTTFDTLVAPSEASTLRSNTERSARSTATGTKERWGLFVLEPQDDNDPDAIDIVALHGLVSASDFPTRCLIMFWNVPDCIVMLRSR
jgi:hypothetical protein